MTNEVNTDKRRIIVSKPLESRRLTPADINSVKSEENKASGNDSPTNERKNRMSDGQFEEILHHQIGLKHRELRGKKFLSTDVRYYVNTLGISIGDIKVDAYNYLDVLMLLDREAKRGKEKLFME